MLQMEVELKQARAVLAAADARYKQDLARWQADLDHERGKVSGRRQPPLAGGAGRGLGQGCCGGDGCSDAHAPGSAAAGQ
jgi:hypothetical protein